MSPMGVTAPDHITTGLLPALSIKRVNTRLPIEKATKLIDPIMPMIYGG